ncbi:MAG: hypothetical protein AB4038_11950 [Prochloraceae cyanobacterium]
MQTIERKQVKYCQIQGKLAGIIQVFQGLIYQKREFIKIKFYPKNQKINAYKSCQKLVDSRIPAIIIKEKRGYSLWILFKSLFTQKYSINSASDFMIVSVKQQGFNRFKSLAIFLAIHLIGTVILASNMALLIPEQTLPKCDRIESDCPGKIEVLEKLTQVAMDSLLEKGTGNGQQATDSQN